MHVVTFDVSRNIYHFRFTAIDTLLHAHPAVEIVLATRGSFSLITAHKHSKGLHFCMIPANLKHRLEAEDAALEVLMVESFHSLLQTLLAGEGIDLGHEPYIGNDLDQGQRIMHSIEQLARQSALWQTADDRVNTCLQVMNEQELSYHNLLSELCQTVHLSESRLSHLFKAHTGLSMKKYLLWSKLKRAIGNYLVKHDNLTAASLSGGFFDQAHFTRAFKEQLGIKPSGAYNSRTVQL